MPRSRSPSPTPSPSGLDEDDADEDSEDIVGVQESEDEEEVPDIRNQFLMPSFRPKPVKSSVSKYARDTLRAPFLGRPMLKEERRLMVESYFCSDVDYKEFSAPTIHGK